MAERVTLGLSTKMEDVKRADIQDERNHEAVLKELSALSDHPNAIESEKKVGIIIRLWTTLVRTCRKTRFVEEAFFTLLRKTTLAVLTPLYSEISMALRVELFNHVFHCGKLMDQIVSGCLQSCINLIKLGEDPWGNSFVEWEPLLAGACGLEDNSVQTYLKNESREIALARVHFLTIIGCDDHALCLVKYILKHHIKLYGCNVWKTDDSPTNNLNAFSCLEWFLFLLQRKKTLPEIVKITDGLSCHEGVLAIRMLRRRRGCKPLANFLAQVFMVHEILEPKVYCCTKELFKYWCISMKEKNMSLLQVTETTKKLFGQYASSSAHFYLLVDTLWEQFGESFLQLYIELFIRAFTIDINHLDVARSSGKKNEVTTLEVQLANMFMKLSMLFSHSHEQVSRECVLSAFSLRPNEERLLVLQTLTHGILSDQSHLWNEDLEMAVDTFHNDGVDQAKNFHPLLVGVEKIPYHLISDLVIVLEGIRCHTFQFNVFDWRNVVTELHDYLSSFAKRDSHYLSFITHELKSKVRTHSNNDAGVNSITDSNVNRSFVKNEFRPPSVGQQLGGIDLSMHDNLRVSTVIERRESDNSLSPWAQSFHKRSPAVNHIRSTATMPERSSPMQYQANTGNVLEKADGCDWHRNSPGANHAKVENINRNTLKKNILPNLEYTALALANESKKRLLAVHNLKNSEKPVSDNFSISCNMVPNRSLDNRKSHMSAKLDLNSSVQSSVQNVTSKSRQYDQNSLQQQVNNPCIAKRENVDSHVHTIEKRQKISDTPLKRDAALRGSSAVARIPLEGLASPEHFFTSTQAKQVSTPGNNRKNLLEQSNYNNHLSNDSKLATISSAYVQSSEHNLNSQQLQKSSRIMRIYPATGESLDSRSNSMGLERMDDGKSSPFADRLMPNLTAESSNVVPSIGVSRCMATTLTPAVTTKQFAGSHPNLTAYAERKVSSNYSGSSSLEQKTINSSEQRPRPVHSIESLAKIALGKDVNKELHMPALKLNLPQIKNLTGHAQFPANLVIPYNNNNNNNIQRNADFGSNQTGDGKGIANGAKQTITIPGMVVVKKPCSVSVGDASNAVSNASTIRRGISCKTVNSTGSTIIYKVPYKTKASNSPITLASPTVISSNAILKNANNTTVCNTSVIRTLNGQQRTNTSLPRVFTAHIQSGASGINPVAGLANAIKIQRCYLSPELSGNRETKIARSDILKRAPSVPPHLEAPPLNRLPTKKLHEPCLPARATSAQNPSISDTATDLSVSASQNFSSHGSNSLLREGFPSIRHSVLHASSNVVSPRVAQETVSSSSHMTKFENAQLESIQVKEEKSPFPKSANVPCKASPHASPITALSARVCCSPHELEPCQSCSPDTKPAATSPMSSPTHGLIRVPPQNIKPEQSSPISEVSNSPGLLGLPSDVSSTKKERKKWQCDLCGRFLCSKYTLNMHKKKIHSDNPLRKQKGRPTLSINKNPQSHIDGNSRSVDMNNMPESDPNAGDNNLDSKILKYFADFVDSRHNMNENKVLLNASGNAGACQESMLGKTSHLPNTHVFDQQISGPAVLSAQLVDEQLNNFSLGNESIQPSSELQTSWQVAGTAMRYLNDPTCDDDFFPEFPSSSLDSLSETEPSFYDNSIDGLNKISYSLNESSVSIEDVATKNLHGTVGKHNAPGNNALLQLETSSDAFIRNHTPVEIEKEIPSSSSLIFAPSNSNNASLFGEQLNAVDFSMQSSRPSDANFSSEYVECNSNFKKPFGTMESQNTYDSFVSSSVPEPVGQEQQHPGVLDEGAKKSTNLAVKSLPRSKPEAVVCGFCKKVLCSKDSRRRHIKVVHKNVDFEAWTKSMAPQQSTPAPSDAEESSICSSFSAVDSQSEESNQGSTTAVSCPSKKGISPATNSKLSAMLMSHPLKAECSSRVENMPSKITDKLIAENKNPRESVCGSSDTNSTAMSAPNDSALNFPSERSCEAIAAQGGVSANMLPDSTLLNQDRDASPSLKKKLVVQCSMCDKSFCSTASQRRHLKNVHKCVTDEAKEHERKKESEQECWDKVQNILRKITEETQKNEMLAVKKKAKPSISQGLATSQAKIKGEILSPSMEWPAVKSDSPMPSSSMHLSRTSVISPNSPMVLTSNNRGVIGPLQAQGNQPRILSSPHSVSNPVMPTIMRPAITSTVIVSKRPQMQQQFLTTNSTLQTARPHLKSPIVASLPMRASVSSSLSACSPGNSNLQASNVQSTSFLHTSVIQNLNPSSLQNKQVSMKSSNGKSSDNQFLPLSQFPQRTSQKAHPKQFGRPGVNFLDVEDPNNTFIELEGTVKPYLYAEDGKKNPTVENLLRYFEDMEDDVHTLQNLSTLDEPAIGNPNSLHCALGISTTAIPSMTNALSNNWEEARNNSNSALGEVGRLAPVSTLIDSSLTSPQQNHTLSSAGNRTNLASPVSISSFERSQAPCLQNTPTIHRTNLNSKEVVAEERYFDLVKSQAEDVKQHVNSGDTILLNIAPSISTHLNLSQSEIVSFHNRSVSVTPVEYAQSPVSLSAYQSNANSVSSENDDRNLQFSDENAAVSSPILSSILSPKLSSATCPENKAVLSFHKTKQKKLQNRPLVRNFSTALNSVITQSNNEPITSHHGEGCEPSRPRHNQNDTSKPLTQLNQSAINYSNVQYQSYLNSSLPKSLNKSQNSSLSSSTSCVIREAEPGNFVESLEYISNSDKATNAEDGIVHETTLQCADSTKSVIDQFPSHSVEGDNVGTTEIDQSKVPENNSICEDSFNTSPTVEGSSQISLPVSDPLDFVNADVKTSNLALDTEGKLESEKCQQLAVKDKDLSEPLALSPSSQSEPEEAAMPNLESKIEIQTSSTQAEEEKEPTVPEIKNKIVTDVFPDRIARRKTRRTAKKSRMLVRIENSAADSSQLQSSPSVGNPGSRIDKRIKLGAYSEKRLRRRSETDNLVGRPNAALNSSTHAPIVPLSKKRALNRTSTEKLSTKTNDDTVPPIMGRRTRLKSSVEVKNEVKSKDVKKIRIKKESESSASTSKQPQVKKKVKLSEEEMGKNAAQSVETNCPKLVLKKVPVPISGTNKVGYYVKVTDEIVETKQSGKTSTEYTNNIEKSCRSSNCVVKINRLDIDPGNLLNLQTKTTGSKNNRTPAKTLTRRITRPSKKAPAEISIVGVKSTKKTIRTPQSKMSDCSVMLRKLETPRRLSTTQKAQRPVRNVTKHIFLNEKLYLGPRPIDNNSSPPICITLD